MKFALELFDALAVRKDMGLVELRGAPNPGGYHTCLLKPVLSR